MERNKPGRMSNEEYKELFVKHKMRRLGNSVDASKIRRMSNEEYTKMQSEEDVVTNVLAMRRKP